MNTNKKQGRIRRAKSTLKSSQKSKYSVDDLETDKESNISSYEEDYQEGLWEMNSSQKMDGSMISSTKNKNNKSVRIGEGNIVRSDDLAMNQSMNTSIKSYRRTNTNMTMNSSQMNDSQYADLDMDSDEENEDDSYLTPEQKLLKERWIQIYHKIIKNNIFDETHNWFIRCLVYKYKKQKIKQDEAFEFDVDEDLQLELYEWKDSGCIIECISKLYSLKVDRLSKDAYHLLASMIRGDIGNLKKPDMEDEGEKQEEQDIEEGDKKDKNDQKKKMFKFEEKEIVHGTFEEFNPLSAGQKQIDRPEKLVVDKYDIEFDLDPLFRKKSQYFDDFSSGGLLLNVLNVDKDIQINLTEIEEGVERRRQNEKKISPISSNKKSKKCDYRKQLLSQEYRNKFQHILDGFDADVLPELVDFKMSVLDEIAQQLDFDNIHSLNSENDIKILTQNNRRMEVMDENTSNIVNSFIQSENDKSLFSEINQAFEMNSFLQQNMVYRNISDDSLFQNSSQNKDDYPTSILSQTYTPDNSIFKNNKKIRFDTNDQYFESSDDQTFYNDENPSTQETKQINNSQLSNSLTKIGGGDKTIFTNILLNLNWGDPKQWDIQKLSGAQRKKSRQKKQDDLLLGEIKEDMEAEEQNENYAMNRQYERLTQPQKYIDFSLNCGKEEEDYDDVIGKRFKRYKTNLSAKQAKIKQKNVIQRDCKILTEQIFQIGLKEMGDIKNKLNSKIKEFNPDYEHHFDIFQSSQQPGQTQESGNKYQYYGNEYEGIGFDDLYDNEMDDRFYNPSKYNNQRDNRIFNNHQNSFGKFDIHNSSSPFKRSNQPPQSAYMNNTQYSMYSQNRTQNFFSQTIRKKPVKIRDLKQTVWQTMTQTKSDQNNSQLMSLSQFTDQKQNKKGKGKKQQMFHEEDSLQIENLINQTNSDDLSIKFSELMHQLPDSYGYNNESEGVSIQNCFISLLHLANEKQLRLVDPKHSEQEFFIFLDQPQQENQQVKSDDEIKDS